MFDADNLWRQLLFLAAASTTSIALGVDNLLSGEGRWQAVTGGIALVVLGVAGITWMVAYTLRPPRRK